MSGLSDRAMLVSIKIRNAKFTRTDKDVSDEVSEFKRARKGSARVVKRLFSKQHIGRLNKHLGQVKQWH